MPRQARIDAPDAMHHVIARGIERRAIFEDDADRTDFVRRLGSLVQETGTQCYAWALIPNHFHLLLKTGRVPIATIMRRLLTGYAGGYNRRHGQSGHLFQNRYKSILCQEDAYLKELVRYIHLNPLRAGIVKDLDALDRYPYAGHSALMGKQKNPWQAVNTVLELFGDKTSQARSRYHTYVAEGIELGRRPELVGGGLIRSAGGWANATSLRKAGVFQKSDERILGDGAFVESVLSEADENLARHYGWQARGVTLDHLQRAVAVMTAISQEELVGASKRRSVVRARSLFCYWAVQEFGCTMTVVSRHLKISLPTVSVAFQKGEKLVREGGLVLEDYLNIEI